MLNVVRVKEQNIMLFHLELLLLMAFEKSKRPGEDCECLLVIVDCIFGVSKMPLSTYFC